MLPGPRSVRDTDLWPALEETFGEMRRLMVDSLRARDLSVGQFMTIHRVCTMGELRVSVLANEIGISRPAATALVASLERKGWVRRARSASDRRGVVVRLTPRATRTLTVFDREFAAVVRRTMATLPKAERDGAASTLRTLNRGLREHRQHPRRGPDSR